MSRNKKAVIGHAQVKCVPATDDALGWGQIPSERYHGRIPLARLSPSPLAGGYIPATTSHTLGSSGTPRRTQRPAAERPNVSKINRDIKSTRYHSTCERVVDGVYDRVINSEMQERATWGTLRLLDCYRICATGSLLLAREHPFVPSDRP